MYTEALVSILVVTILIITAYTSNDYAFRLFLKAKDSTPETIVEPVFSERYKGYDTCFLNSDYEYESAEYINIPNITSAIGRGGYVFATADSNVQGDPDLYILKDGAVEGALNTGPGLRDLSVTKDYIYVANSSTVNQIQKIDIKDINNPKLVKSVQVATSSGNTIRFDQNNVYIGTEKAFRPELSVLNENLDILSTYKTDSQINDIYVTDKVYIAASNINQLHILGSTTEHFSPSGWETQEGKSLTASGSEIYFGRTVGGFNNKSNHELFLLNSTSTDIGSGIYGLVSSGDLLFVASRDLEVWKKPFTHLYDISLDDTPVSLSCDKNKLIVGLRNGLNIINYAY